MTNKSWMITRRRTLFISCGLLAGCIVDVIQHGMGQTETTLHNGQQVVIAVLVSAIVWSLMKPPPWQQ